MTWSRSVYNVPDTGQFTGRQFAENLQKLMKLPKQFGKLTHFKEQVRHIVPTKFGKYNGKICQKKRQIVLHVRQNGFRQIIFRQKVPNPTCHEGIQRDAKSWGHGYGKYFQTYQ